MSFRQIRTITLAFPYTIKLIVSYYKMSDCQQFELLIFSDQLGLKLKKTSNPSQLPKLNILNVIFLNVAAAGLHKAFIKFYLLTSQEIVASRNLHECLFWNSKNPYE